MLESRGTGREEGIAALDRDAGTVDLIQVRIEAFPCDSPAQFAGCHLFGFIVRAWMAIARGSPDVREDVALHELAQHGSCSCARYITRACRCIRTCVGEVRGEHVVASAVHPGRVPWCTN